MSVFALLRQGQAPSREQIGELLRAARGLKRAVERLARALEDEDCGSEDGAELAVLVTVAEYFSVAVDGLTGPKRYRDVTEARHVAMYLLLKDFRLRVTDIGRLLGGRDHSTVLHGIRKIERLLALDEATRDAISIIRTALDGRQIALS